MTITFNKKFVMPNFIDREADEDAATDARLLSDTVAIEEFIRLEVIDDEDDDDVDKMINGFTAVIEDDLKLILTVLFNTPEHVSNEFLEPDFLKVWFLLP